MGERRLSGAQEGRERTERPMNDCEEILRRHGPMVYRLALAYTRQVSDAEDVFQEVFLRYVQHSAAFRDEEHRKAWLLRVTVNLCRSLYRRHLRRAEVSLEEQGAVAFQSPEESAVDAAMALLPAKYRAVIHLHYFEGFSTDEAARLLGQLPSTTRTQLTRARKMLGDMLKGDPHV